MVVSPPARVMVTESEFNSYCHDHVYSALPKIRNTLTALPKSPSSVRVRISSIGRLARRFLQSLSGRE